VRATAHKNPSALLFSSRRLAGTVIGQNSHYKKQPNEPQINKILIISSSFALRRAQKVFLDLVPHLETVTSKKYSFRPSLED
jgi:hypothetical protein